MYVSPQAGRATINSEGGQMRISIPTSKNIFMILFVSAWLCGWLFGEVSVIVSLISTGPHRNASFLFFWLCAWTIGGGYAILTLLWNVAGKEDITFQQGMLKIEKKVFGVGLSREYSLSSTENFRIINKDNSNTWFRWGSSFWGFGGNGRIKFDYGMKTIDFALGIDEAEAKYILENLSEKGYVKDKIMMV